MGRYDEYESPLSHRYPSPEMKRIFSPRHRASTWRTMWLWLAEAEQELGLTQITKEAIEAIRTNLVVSDESFDVIAAEEKIRRHDVMASIKALETEAPGAAGIIHIGTTSCFDNTELIFMRDSLDLLLPKLAKVIHNLSEFAIKYKDLPTLGYTHYQAAQPITIGRRAAQWAQNLTMDLETIEWERSRLKFRGAQGTTGTQASFMEIFQGDTGKIDRLNEILCEKAGFKACYDISIQTYPRKVDSLIADALSGFGASAIQMATDIRLLAHDGILDEPHEATQTGSSAMSYKMNPMRSERICSLGRKLKNLSSNFKDTFSTQWLERTLDDNAIRRMDIPEMFLLADSILILLDNVTNGLLVFPALVERKLDHDLPFMATENIIMKLVSKGVSRQEAHERIRVLSRETVHAMKLNGEDNDLIVRIKKDEFFKPVWDDLDSILDPKKFTGRSAELTERYLGPNGPVAAQLDKYRDHIDSTATATLSV